MKLEIIATSLSDSIAAEQAGADRIELVSGIAEGGLTPSYGCIEGVVNALSIPVFVMIRPHSQSFVYNADDFKAILKDIAICKQLGADGIVFGSLTEAGEIHEAQLQAVIEAAAGMDITFHRAFDEVVDQEKALETLLRYPQVTRILTSGGAAKVHQAVPQMQKLFAQSQDSELVLLPGSGLSTEVVEVFVKQVPAQELHFGSGVRVNESFQHPIDAEKITKIRSLVTENK